MNVYKDIPYDINKRLRWIFHSLVALNVDVLTQITTDLWQWFGTWLTITGVVGSLLIPKYVKGRFEKIFLLVWITFSLLISLLGLFPDYDRIFCIIPFHLTASFLLFLIYRTRFRIFVDGFEISTSATRVFMFFIICLILSVSFFQAFAFQQERLGPFLPQKDYEELLWIRDNFPNNTIVMVNKETKNVVFWSQAILMSEKRKVYLYFGEIEDLLNGRITEYTRRLKLIKEDVLNNLENFTILIPKLTYDLDDVKSRFLSKVMNRDIYYLILHNPGDRQSYCNLFSKISSVKIGQIGWEANFVINTIASLCLPVTSFGGGRDHLPPLEVLKSYNLLILNYWYPSAEDLEKIVGAFSNGVNIIATGVSVYSLYKCNKNDFELIFGAAWADDSKETYVNVTYDKQHYLTSHMKLPYVTSGLSFPIGNLTKGVGLGSVSTDNTDAFVLVLNEINGTRAAAFGRMLPSLDENEIALFKKLVLWSLGFQIE
jgi:hypothetical protein